MVEFLCRFDGGDLVGTIATLSTLTSSLFKETAYSTLNPPVSQVSQSANPLHAFFL